jgi:hypothetical protein
MLFTGSQRPTRGATGGATGGASGGEDPVLEQVTRQMEQTNLQVPYQHWVIVSHLCADSNPAF